MHSQCIVFISLVVEYDVASAALTTTERRTCPASLTLDFMFARFPGDPPPPEPPSEPPAAPTANSSCSYYCPEELMEGLAGRAPTMPLAMVVEHGPMTIHPPCDFPSWNPMAQQRFHQERCLYQYIIFSRLIVTDRETTRMIGEMYYHGFFSLPSEWELRTMVVQIFNEKNMSNAHLQTVLDSPPLFDEMIKDALGTLTIRTAEYFAMFQRINGFVEASDAAKGNEFVAAEVASPSSPAGGAMDTVEGGECVAAEASSSSPPGDGASDTAEGGECVAAEASSSSLPGDGASDTVEGHGGVVKKGGPPKFDEPLVAPESTAACEPDTRSWHPACEGTTDTLVAGGSVAITAPEPPAPALASTSVTAPELPASASAPAVVTAPELPASVSAPAAVTAPGLPASTSSPAPATITAPELTDGDDLAARRATVQTATSSAAARGGPTNDQAVRGSKAPGGGGGGGGGRGPSSGTVGFVQAARGIDAQAQEQAQAKKHGFGNVSSIFQSYASLGISLRPSASTRAAAQAPQLPAYRERKSKSSLPADTGGNGQKKRTSSRRQRAAALAAANDGVDVGGAAELCAGAKRWLGKKSSSSAVTPSSVSHDPKSKFAEVGGHALIASARLLSSVSLLLTQPLSNFLQ